MGCVIKGQTDHYQHVCSATTSGISSVMTQTGVPCGFGILTTDTLEQALSRVGGHVGHAGRAAARACAEQVKLIDRIRGNHKD